MTAKVRVLIVLFCSLLCSSIFAQGPTWRDPSTLLGISYDQFHASFPDVYKKSKPVKDSPDLSACFINGHVDSFLNNTNGARLTFEHNTLISIEFSVWRGSATTDSLIVRYGPFDGPGQTPGNLQGVGNSDAKKCFWTKKEYGIVWEQHFKKSFSDAMAFNADTERIWFVLTK